MFEYLTLGRGAATYTTSGAEASSVAASLLSSLPADVGGVRSLVGGGGSCCCCCWSSGVKGSLSRRPFPPRAFRFLKKGLTRIRDVCRPLQYVRYLTTGTVLTSLNDITAKLVLLTDPERYGTRLRTVCKVPTILPTP